MIKICGEEFFASFDLGGLGIGEGCFIGFFIGDLILGGGFGWDCFFCIILMFIFIGGVILFWMGLSGFRSRGFLMGEVFVLVVLDMDMYLEVWVMEFERFENDVGFSYVMFLVVFNLYLMFNEYDEGFLFWYII